VANLIKREPTTPLPQIAAPKASLRKGSDIEDYLGIFRRRKWTILTTLLLVFAASALRTRTSTSLYRSTVTILIEEEGNVLPYPQVYESQATNPQHIQTQTIVLRSRTLAERVVKALRLAKDPQRIEAVANWVRGNLEVIPIPNTQIVRVSFSSTDAEEAARIVNQLADEYTLYTFESKYEATTQARDFLERELTSLKEKVAQSEASLVDYARSRNPNLLMAPTENPVLKKLIEFNNELTAIEQKLLSNRYNDIKDCGPETFPESAKNDVIKSLELQLAADSRELALLSAQFGPGWPDVKRVRRQVEHLREQLARAVENSIQQERIEYELFLKQRARLLEAIQEQSRLAGRFNEDSIHYNMLKREVESDQQVYQGLLQRLKQAMVLSGETSTNIRIVERGLVPSTPYSPNVTMNLLLGAGVGLLLGIGFAAAQEYFDKSLKGPADIESHLGLPALGIIPFLGKDWVQTEAVALKKRENKGSLKSVRIEQIGLIPDLCWESYRSLRTALVLARPLNEICKTILVTSPLPREGKTTTCLNLGVSFALSRASTLVIELDLRKPSLARRLGLPEDLGVASYLSGECQLCDLIRPTGIPNLSLLPAGPASPDAPELLGARLMREAFSVFPKLFNYVLIDSPPLLAVTDALLVAPQVDGVLLVTSGGDTSRDAVQAARDLLLSAGAKLLGVLINGADKRYRGYSHYYTYYSDYSDRSSRA